MVECGINHRHLFTGLGARQSINALGQDLLCVINDLRQAMNRILDTLIGPQSPLLGATRAHITQQLTASNWHCKALAAFDDSCHQYLFITQQVCQRSRQTFYSIVLQERQHACAIVTFFELTHALEWLEQCPWRESTIKANPASPLNKLGAMAA